MGTFWWVAFFLLALMTQWLSLLAKVDALMKEIERHAAFEYTLRRCALEAAGQRNIDDAARWLTHGGYDEAGKAYAIGKEIMDAYFASFSPVNCQEIEEGPHMLVHREKGAEHKGPFYPNWYITWRVGER